MYLAELYATSQLIAAQSALTTFTVMCGVLLICLLAPPIRTSIGNEAFKGDWRLSLLALGLLVSYGVVLSVAPLRTLFDLMPLRMSDYALIGTGVIAWGTGLRWAWRVRLLERLLQVDGR